ncbi:GWxTD domain-containing protein [candidate division KSB1 bacterium]
MKHNTNRALGKIFVFSFTVFFSILSISDILYSQTAEEYYKQGLELKKQEKYREAVDVFKKAIGKDRGFGDAYYEMGLCYQQLRTPTFLKRAEEALIDALREGDDDLKYLKALALIYEDRFFFSVAKTMWERMLDIDSMSTDALLGIAKYYEHEAERYRFRVDPYTPNSVNELPPGISVQHFFYDSNMVDYRNKYRAESFLDYDMLLEGKSFYLAPPIRWDKYVAEDDSASMEVYDKILKIDPENRDALFGKALLYYDKYEYQHSTGEGNIYEGYIHDKSEMDKFLELFQELINNHPDDKDGHLFLGLGYHKMRQFEPAFEEFRTARNLMEDDEKLIFDNVGFLQTGGFNNDNMITAEETEKNYWQKKDPLFLSPVNERLLEHYSRVAEANLRWTVPRFNIEGWRTEQGKILIKYGRPKNRVKYRNLDSLLAFDHWQYPDFTFVFRRLPGVEYDNFNLAVWNNFNFIEIIEDVEEEFPDYYEFIPKGNFIPAHYDYANFRGEDGSTRLEIYYGLPFSGLNFSEEGDYYYGSLKSGIFLHDHEWNSIVEDIKDIDIELAVSENDTSSNDLAVFMDSYLIDQPDSYLFAFETMDYYSDNAGTYRDSVRVRKFDFSELQLSDIQLAGNIEIIDGSNPPLRDNLEIAPNPSRFYTIDQNIYIYFEIYNIMLGGEPGSTDISVNYNLSYMGEDDYSVVDFVKGLFINEQLIRNVTTEFNMKGNKQNESMFLRIDHSLTKPGPYSLRLEVTDRIARTTVKDSTVLRIFEK